MNFAKFLRAKFFREPLRATDANRNILTIFNPVFLNIFLLLKSFSKFVPRLSSGYFTKGKTYVQENSQATQRLTLQ